MSSSLKQKSSNIHSITLPNKIKILVVENQAADLISGRLFFRNAGSLIESYDKSGISHLVGSVIIKGTKNLSALEIAERVESIGAGLGADGSNDYFIFSLKTVSHDFAEILQLLGEIIRYPSFPLKEVDLEKKLTLQSIRSQKEQPFNVAFDRLRSLMYGEHPYGTSILGTEETVSQLTAENLHQYHQNYFRPDELTISISGRITKEEAIRLVEEVFGDWETPLDTLLLQPLPKIDSQPTREVIVQDTQQSIVMLGYLTAAVDSPDYPVLKLLSTYLGNGLSSRLFVELREKRGLAYDVSAFYPTRLQPAPFVAYMGTAPENTEIAVTGIRTEIERLTTTLLSEEELNGAKNKLLGQYALGKQTNSEIAQIYGWYETLGLGIEFDTIFQEKISAITPQMAKDVAIRYFKSPYISIVQPESIDR